MTTITASVAALLVATVHQIDAGTPLADVLPQVQPGDVVRLGPGVHHGSLGRLADVKLEGAGADKTLVEAPPGQDVLHAVGTVSIRGLALRAGPGKCALKVFLGGAATLEGVTLQGGSCGAFVADGTLDGRDVALESDGYGLLAQKGQIRLELGSAHGGSAGIALTSGKLVLRRFAVTGPSEEGGISLTDAVATLEIVLIRDAGYTGLNVGPSAKVVANELTVANTRRTDGGMLGDCVQSRKASLRIASGLLLGCAGAGVETFGGNLRVDGVDVVSGTTGGFVFMDGAKGLLHGNMVKSSGPGIVVGPSTRAAAQWNRWKTEPMKVACADNGRLDMGLGEQVRDPCAVQ